MEDWLGFVLCVLLLLNILLKFVDWYLSSKKPEPMTFLQFIKALDLIDNKSQLTKDEMESMFTSVKNFILIEIRKAEKKRYDNEKGFGEEK